MSLLTARIGPYSSLSRATLFSLLFRSCRKQVAPNIQFWSSPVHSIFRFRSVAQPVLPRLQSNHIQKPRTDNVSSESLVNAGALTFRSTSVSPNSRPPLESQTNLENRRRESPPPTDEQLLQLIQRKELQIQALEKEIEDLTQAVRVRRQALVNLGLSKEGMKLVPFENYDYGAIQNACCENVIGYVSLPIGIAGPVLVNGFPVPIPLATTEGCLVASTHRGCKALNESGGASCVIYNDGMTRAPILQFSSIASAFNFKNWLEKPCNYNRIRQTFEGTSRFIKLESIKLSFAGRAVHVRFRAKTGDAMGMNMISKAVEKSIMEIQHEFVDASILSLSGNMCTDKKPSAINWLEGRGKSVMAEAILPQDVVKRVLKTSVDEIVRLNTNKNLVGSSMAGGVGGNNAHASNIVTAIFIATGQDVAQNVESSNCITLMEKEPNGDLRISCTMPSIEVGTIGGGTHLQAQRGCLSLMGIDSKVTSPTGENAEKLAKAVCVGVLAGELSLMAALSAGHLVRSHLQYNRSKQKMSKQTNEVGDCVVS